jgi:aspartate racemase
MTESVLVPDPVDRADLHRFLYDELCQRVLRAVSRAAVLAVIERLVGVDDVDGVILGCTELELLVGKDDVGVPVFPTTALHVAAAVDAALG